MTTNPPGDDGSDELEISLDDGAELQLHDAEIDADGRPIEFSINGVIKDVDSALMERFDGNTLEPTAVRFRLIKEDE